MPVPESADEAREIRPVCEPDALLANNRITRLIERLATPLFVSIAILFLGCFNGQWRIGLDSANYRGLADSIASGTRSPSGLRHSSSQQHSRALS